MKQHYKTSIYAILFLLLAALYAFQIQRVRTGKPIPDSPKSFTPKLVKAQSSVANESTITSIQQSLAKREYNISFDEEKKTLQSPNRKQNLRAYYKPGELTINNRIDSAGHNFSLKLVNEGIFADGKRILSPQKQATLENLDNKLQIKHDGFTEEFINNEEGVRQNFIVKDAPKSTKALQVRLSAVGLKVNDLQNNELQFYTKNKKGKVTSSLIYKDIKCWDADGKALPATLRYEHELVMLTVDVQHAAYPVTIDPIVVNGNPGNANATLESNQAGAQAGYAISSAGDVNGDGYSDVIVGAPFYDKGENNEGAAFVYYGSASGLGANAAVTLESNQAEAQFGRSVSSAGDVNKDGFSDVIIGAPNYDNGQTNEGGAFVYMGAAAGLTANASVVLESNQADSNFGLSMSLAGDVNADGYSDVLIGSPLFDKGQNNEGATFIYHGSPSGIGPGATRILESHQVDAQFGFSVAGAGDVNGDGYSDIIIGSIQYDKGQSNEGVAFVYHGSAIGVNPAPVSWLEANQISAVFGWSVASAGDVNGDGYSDVIIGAYSFDNGQSNEGAAFVFHGSATGINVTIAQTLESNQANARGGFSVASAGDVNGDGYADVIVGATHYDNGQSNEGAAFIYQGSSTGLSATPVSTLESNQAGAQLGSSVSSAGDVNGDGYSDVVVGAVLYDKGQADEGAAFVWLGMAEGVSNVAAVKLEGDQDLAQMGWSVSDAGDVNGDGFDDIAIAANGYDNGQLGEGAVFIYHGSSIGLNSMAVTKIESDQIYASMGEVASAGDVNGDGYGDLIIGLPLYGEKNAGTALIFHGSAQGIVNSIKAKLEDQQGEDGNFGSSVACAGDVNGDGYSDVIVGAPGFDVAPGYLDEGMAFIYLGSANGINSNGAVKIPGSSNGFNMGAVTGLGDVNGDGFGDIAIGSPFYTNGDDFEGAVLIHYGSATGIKVIPDLTLEANKAECRLGADVSKASDINGDGYMDLVAGASHYSAGQYVEGAIYVFYGSAGGLNTSPTIIESNNGNSYFGSCISTAGDVNGDGFSDVVVGAVGYSNGENNEGAVLLYLGSMSGMNTNYSFKLEGNQIAAFLGNSVSGAGDINGDGYSDIIMGAHQHDNGQTNEGLVYVHFGNAGNRNLQNNLRLYNANLTTPINQSQKAKNNFGAGLFAKSFLGTGKGALVWETRAKGQGFSKGANNVITNSTQSSGKSLFANLGATGTELKSLIAKQGLSTKVRVRVRYSQTTALTGQLYGPWRYLPAYLLGNSIAPAPEEVVDDMLETAKRKVDESMAGKENEFLYVYPNPTSERLMLKFENADQVKNIQLLTNEGRSIYKSSVAVSEIDVRDMAAGNYILLITHGDGSTSTRKVVIEK